MFLRISDEDVKILQESSVSEEGVTPFPRKTVTEATKRKHKIYSCFR